MSDIEEIKEMKKMFYHSIYGDKAIAGFDFVVEEMEHWSNFTELKKWNDDFVVFALKQQDKEMERLELENTKLLNANILLENERLELKEKLNKSGKHLINAFQVYYQSDKFDDERTFGWNIDEFLEEQLLTKNK